MHDIKSVLNSQNLSKHSIPMFCAVGFWASGKQKVPLPARAYEQIRQQFIPIGNEDFVGFVEEKHSS